MISIFVLSTYSMNSDPINRDKPKPDPLGVVPDIEWSFQNVTYGIGVLISLLLIAYGLATHFSSYESIYYPAIANVIHTDCTRFPVNNHRSEYHCVVGIEYPSYPGSTDMTTNSLTFVDTERFFEGDQIEILVDHYNSLNIEVKAISDHNLALIYCICGILLFITVTGIRFMRVV
jgi:hypothetical protein